MFHGDAQNIHESWLTYGSYLTVDVQNIHVSQLTYRTCQHYGRQSEHLEPDQVQTRNYLSAIGINFPTPSPTT